MRTFPANELELSYESFRQLRLNGKCNLGISDADAEKITKVKGLIPNSSGTRKAFALWNFVGFICFGYSIYQSFTSFWWAFIIGLLCSSFIFNMNKKSNSSNVLEDAFNNKDFYETLVTLNVLKYQIDESVAEEFKR